LASLVAEEPVAELVFGAPLPPDVSEAPAPTEGTFSVRARQLNANMVAFPSGGALLGLVCWYLLQL
jgi:hypothetical protein